MHFAVADLGTNAFHLLITDHHGHVCAVHEFPVLLGQEDPKLQVLSVEALKRMRMALIQMQSVLYTFSDVRLSVVATSAIRTSANSEVAKNLIFDHLDVHPKLISGDTEAEYIYKGALRSLIDKSQTLLVMDIGGGSVEFIIGKGQDIFWKSSYLLGAARLKSLFPLQVPRRWPDTIALNQYIFNAYNTLFAMIHRYQPTALVGAAGAFDTIAAILKISSHSGNAGEMTLEQWGYIYQLIANGSLHERKKLPGMPPYRVTMMPYAMELIQVLIQEWRPERFYLSPAALKEGVLSEMLEAW